MRLDPISAITVMLAIVVVITSISLAISSIQNIDIKRLVEQVNNTATDTHIIADRLANTEIGVLVNRTNFLEVLQNNSTEEIIEKLDQIHSALNITS